MVSCIGRMKRSLRGCSFKPSIGLDLFEEGFCLDLFGFMISLPFLDRLAWEPEEIMEKWGVYLYGGTSQWKFDSIWFCWGNKTKCYHMPWEWKHIKVEVQRPDGSWVKQVSSWEESPENPPDGRMIWKFDYKYTLQSGEVQYRTAEVYVERREWRRKFISWLPLFAKKRMSIDYTFDGEVGEGSGSWKGGCISSGQDMRRGETVEQCFRRMERERKF